MKIEPDAKTLAMAKAARVNPDALRKLYAEIGPILPDIVASDDADEIAEILRAAIERGFAR